MRQRFTGTLNWLLPGTGVKRWIVLAALGLVLLLDAITRWFIAEGTGIHINEILDDIVDDYFPPVYLTGILAFLGIGLLIASVWMWTRSIVHMTRLEKLDLRWVATLRPPPWFDDLEARGCVVYR